MNVTFRKVSSQEAYTRFVAFLTEDVVRSGGSAGEVIDMHGTLWRVTVCAVPGGTCLMQETITRIEAIAWLMSDEE